MLNETLYLYGRQFLTPIEYGLDVNKGTMTKILSFRTLISGFIKNVALKDAYELGEKRL